MKNNTEMPKFFYLLADIVIIIISFFVTYYVRFNTPLLGEELGNWGQPRSYVAIILYLIPIYLITYFCLQLYRLRPQENGWYQVLKIVISNVIVFLLFIMLLFFQKEYDISRKFLMLFFIMNTVLTVAARILIIVNKIKTDKHIGLT